MMNYIETLRKELEGRVSETSKALQAFPRLANGMTPDSVKQSPAYLAAKQSYSTAFAALRAFNGTFRPTR